MLIGYARVSTQEQDTAAQVAALKAAGCEEIFREKASGGRWDRPKLMELLGHLRKGDVAGCLEARPAVPLAPRCPDPHGTGPGEAKPAFGASPKPSTPRRLPGA